MQFLTIAFTVTAVGTCSREDEVSNFEIKLGIEKQPGESHSKYRNLLHLNLASACLGELLEWSVLPKPWSAPPAASISWRRWVGLPGAVLSCRAPRDSAKPRAGPALRSRLCASSGWTVCGSALGSFIHTVLEEMINISPQTCSC